jgi:hypothetical protein
MGRESNYPICLSDRRRKSSWWMPGKRLTSSTLINLTAWFGDLGKSGTRDPS